MCLRPCGFGLMLGAPHWLIIFSRAGLDRWANLVALLLAPSFVRSLRAPLGGASMGAKDMISTNRAADWAL